MKDTAASDENIKTKVLEAQRLSVKLPVVRKAAANVVVKDENGTELFSLEEGQTVVCDIVSQIPLRAFWLLPSTCVSGIAIHNCSLS